MVMFDEMKQYVGFTDADAGRLQRAWAIIAPCRATILERFYEPILRTPAARAVLRDEEQVERLKRTLDTWLEELFLGPWDEAYYLRRQRIGRIHVHVGLPSRLMFTAMSAVRVACIEILADDVDAMISLDRVTSLDLAIMTGTYVDGRRAEAETVLQQLIVSHLPVTVLLVGPSGRIAAATRADILADRELVGLPVLEAFPKQLADGIGDAIVRALASQREVTLHRVDMTEDGVVRSFRFNIVPLQHEVAAALIHVEELTQAIEAEARVRRSEALAALGTMSETVAHELRNPLAGISGAMQVIAQSLPPDDRRRPIMQKVDDQVKRLNTMVTDLLAYARPAPAKLQSVQLADIARSSSSVLDHPDIAVLGAGSATADPDLVQLILVNLLQNAVQAGASRIEVHVAPGRVLVTDDGPGIADEARDRLFEPFFTTRVRGSGLGLPTSRKVAASMGGQLSVTTGPLRGAGFELVLRDG